MPITAKRFAPLFIDFTFKKVFASEQHKNLLIALIEAFLKSYLQAKIVDVFLLPSEQINKTRKQRVAVFDLHCTDNLGNRFIIEVQISKQDHFLGRILYYISQTITNLVKKGQKYNFDYPRIYSLNFLNYEPEPKGLRGEIVERIGLFKIKKRPEFMKPFTHIHIALAIIPRFKKTLAQCRTTSDLWLYLFRNLHKMDKIPPRFNNKLFRPVFEIAEISNFSESELHNYEAHMKGLSDYDNTIEYAGKEGERRGERREERRSKKRLKELFTLWESGVPIAEAKRKFGLAN